MHALRGVGLEKGSCNVSSWRARAFFFCVCVTLGVAGLQGCATRQTAVWSAAKSLVRPESALDEVVLRPDLRYLRVTVERRPILMVLGYVDLDLHGRPVEVWYSADGEVLRLQSGRLVGMAGAPIEWLNVRLPAKLPDWSGEQAEGRYERLYDEMPDYRWARRDQVTVRSMLPPGDTQLQGLAPEGLRWFGESAHGRDLPVARYAVMPGMQSPLYGEQCLGASFCLSWQVWPPRGLSPSPSR